MFADAPSLYEDHASLDHAPVVMDPRADDVDRATACVDHRSAVVDRATNDVDHSASIVDHARAGVIPRFMSVDQDTTPVSRTNSELIQN